MRWLVAVLFIPMALAGCGTGGGTDPVPGTYSGTGDNIVISFTVSSDLVISTLSLEVPTISGGGAVDELEGNWPVEDGEFVIYLRSSLGLEDITVEGRFIEDGTEATGSFTVELASGVEQKSGDDLGTSGNWNAAID